MMLFGQDEKEGGTGRSWNPRGGQSSMQKHQASIIVNVAPDFEKMES